VIVLQGTAAPGTLEDAAATRVEPEAQPQALVVMDSDHSVFDGSPFDDEVLLSVLLWSALRMHDYLAPPHSPASLLLITLTAAIVTAGPPWG
jgi:hypothetical protein